MTSEPSNTDTDTEMIYQPLGFTLKSVDHCVYEVNQSSHPRLTPSYGVNCGRFDKEIMFASLSGYFVNRLKVWHGYQPPKTFYSSLNVDGQSLCGFDE